LCETEQEIVYFVLGDLQLVVESVSVGRNFVHQIGGLFGDASDVYLTEKNLIIPLNTLQKPIKMTAISATQVTERY